MPELEWGFFHILQFGLMDPGGLGSPVRSVHSVDVIAETLAPELEDEAIEAASISDRCST